MLALMMAFMLLLWGSFIALAGTAIAVIIRIIGRRPRVRWARRDTALETLRERFARGEIDEAEFRERRVLDAE